jgi:hypothetical protein
MSALRELEDGPQGLRPASFNQVENPSETSDSENTAFGCGERERSAGYRDVSAQGGLSPKAATR